MYFVKNIRFDIGDEIEWKSKNGPVKGRVQAINIHIVKEQEAVLYQVLCDDERKIMIINDRSAYKIED